jgi:hypothetical protein
LGVTPAITSRYSSTRQRLAFRSSSAGVNMDTGQDTGAQIINPDNKTTRHAGSSSTCLKTGTPAYLMKTHNRRHPVLVVFGQAGVCNGPSWLTLAVHGPGVRLAVLHVHVLQSNVSHETCVGPSTQPSLDILTTL